MKKSRIVLRILSLILVALLVFVLPISAVAQKTPLERLSLYKQYFVRTMGSYARAEMKTNNILASLKVSQAIYESGYGTSVFGTTANNLFCIKAYSTWEGMVFDRPENLIYSNIVDYRVIKGPNFTGSAWRAYDNWIDSIADHSALLHTSRYADEGIPGMFDYVEAAYAVIRAGYTTDEGYSRMVIKLIEDYGLTEYDDITPNAQGVIAITMDNAELFIGLGESFTLSANILSDEQVEHPLTWASLDTSVATVDQTGRVHGVNEGYTLITASIGNREACCIVTVTKDNPNYSGIVYESATTTANLNVRQSPDPTADRVGMFLKDTSIKITGLAVETGTTFNEWYPVTGVGDKGTVISGWVAGEYLNIGDNLKVYKNPGTDQQPAGKLFPGTYVNFTGEAQGGFHPITAKDPLGSTISGWLKSEHIKLLQAPEAVDIKKVGFNRYELNRDKNVDYQLKFAVDSYYAPDKTLMWTTSDPTVATVVDGKITTKNYGTATITATAANGVSASCTVNVTARQALYTAKTVARLYVRIEDNESSKNIGKIASGSQITVIDNYHSDTGLIDDGWYFVEAEMESGEIGRGYSKADFIFLLSKKDSEPIQEEDIQLDGDVLTLQGEYLYGADPTYTVGDLLSNIKNPNAYVYDREEKLLGHEDKISTGCTLKLIDNEFIKASAFVVIMGDVNGNGTIDSGDYLMVKRYVLGTLELSGPFLESAKLNEKEITAFDYLMLKRIVLGTFMLSQSS